MEKSCSGYRGTLCECGEFPSGGRSQDLKFRLSLSELFKRFLEICGKANSIIYCGITLQLSVLHGPNVIPVPSFSPKCASTVTFADISLTKVNFDNFDRRMNFSKCC